MMNMMNFAVVLKAACVLLAGTLSIHSFAAGGADLHLQASKAQASTPYAKPGAPVRLMSPAEFSLAKGDELSLEVELSTHPLGKTVVKLAPGSGLTISGQLNYSAQGERRIVMPLQVTAQAAALSYVHIWVEHTGVSGQKTTRALAIALDSRPVQLPLQYKAKVVKPYVEMQATEVIR